MPFLSYLFWPNPGPISPGKFSALLALSISLMVLSVLIRVVRRHTEDPKLRKLSASWGRMSLWFGISGVVLTVARNEGIQFISMRFLWLLWLLGLLGYLAFQVRQWQLRYYEVLPKAHLEDPREKYLPRKRRK